MGLHLLRRFAYQPQKGMLAIRVLRTHRRILESLRLEPEPCDIAQLQLQYCCSQTGIDKATVIGIITELFCKMPTIFLPGCIKPGLEDFISAAQKRGILLGIVSDYPAIAKLKALGLDNKFAVVVSAGHPSIGRLKPHPLALLNCLQQLQISPSESIYVGDRHDVDAPCALRAGVHPVVIGAKRRDATYSCVVNYAELDRLCWQAGGRHRVSA